MSTYLDPYPTPERQPRFRHDSSGDWIKDVIEAGMKILDVDDSLQYIAAHVTEKGVWEKGVVSPSLVATMCRLARLKKYLGHEPHPGAPKHMAISRGVPDAISLINMDRGFVAEGLLVAAMKAAIPDRIIATAPLYVPRWKDPQTGIVYTGHPDMLVLGEQGWPELVQFKCPSMFKFERISKLGDDDALETYRAQMITELFIARHDPRADTMATARKEQKLIPYRNTLGVFCWEHTGKDVRPKLNVVPLDWDDSMESIPLVAGDELEADSVGALAMDQWPEPYAEHQWNVYPCSYCSYSRLGDYTADPPLPKCDDHAAWKKEKDGQVPS